MKNLIIATLAAAQVMDWWCKYCRSGEDMVWCTLALLYFFLVLLYWLDKQAEKRKRIRNTSREIERVITEKYNLRREYGQSAME